MEFCIDTVLHSRFICSLKFINGMSLLVLKFFILVTLIFWFPFEICICWKCSETSGFPFFFFFPPCRWRCSCYWHWAMLSKLMVKRMDCVIISWHWNQDPIVWPYPSLVLWEMVKHWIPLPSRMPFFISSPLLIREVLSFMCLREGGLQEASTLPATLRSSWKKVLSFLDLR